MSDINDTKSTSFVVNHPRSLWTDNGLVLAWFDLSVLFVRHCHLRRICQLALPFVLSVLKESGLLREAASGLCRWLDLFMSFFDVKFLREEMVFQLLSMSCFHKQTFLVLCLLLFFFFRLLSWDFTHLREQLIVKFLVIWTNSNHIHVFRSLLSLLDLLFFRRVFFRSRQFKQIIFQLTLPVLFVILCEEHIECRLLCMVRVSTLQYFDDDSTFFMLHQLAFGARFEHLNQPKLFSKLYPLHVFNQNPLYYEGLNKFFD